MLVIISFLMQTRRYFLMFEIWFSVLQLDLNICQSSSGIKKGAPETISSNYYYVLCRLTEVNPVILLNLFVAFTDIQIGKFRQYLQNVVKIWMYLSLHFKSTRVLFVVSRTFRRRVRCDSGIYVSFSSCFINNCCFQLVKML